MATVVDPGSGALAQAIAQLVSGVGSVVFKEQIREAELKQNPDQIQALSAAYRRAKDVGRVEDFRKAIGVREEFLKNFEAFPATFAESVERERIGQGTAAVQVGAETSTARNVQAGQEALTSLQGPQKAAFAQVMNDVLSGKNAEEAINANVPFLTAASMAAGRTFDKQNFEYQGDLINIRRNAGVDQLSVDYEKLKTKIGIGAAEAYQNWFSTLDPNSHTAKAAVFALENPNLLSHIQFHENLKFQEALELAQSRGTPADKIALTLRLNEAWQTAVDRFQKADVDKAEPGVAQAAVDNLNSIRLLIEDANELGLIEPIDVSVGSFVKRGRLELERKIFTPDVKAKLKEIGVENVEAFDQMTDEQVAQALTALDPRTRETFVSQLKEYERQQAEFEERTRVRPFGPGTVGRERLDAATGELIKRRERAPEYILFKELSDLYNGLSTDYKSFLDRMSQPASGPGRQF